MFARPALASLWLLCPGVLSILIAQAQAHAQCSLQPVSSSLFSHPVRSFAELPNGNVFVGVAMIASQTVPVWSGASWGQSGIPAPHGAPNAMVALTNNQLLLAGYFYTTIVTPFGIQTITNYAAVTGPPVSHFRIGYPGSTEEGTAIARLPNGTFVVGVNISGASFLQPFTSTGQSIGLFSIGPGPLHALAAAASGTLYAGGQFAGMGNMVQGGPSSWSSLGSGVDAPVRAILVTRQGDVIAGGDFVNAGGAPANHVARWDGTAWSPLGVGVNGSVRTLLELPNGDLLAGGSFTMAGGLPATNIARWNGSSWVPVAGAGGSVGGAVHALFLSSDGTIFVGGELSVGAQGFAALVRTTCPASVAVSGTGCAGSGGLNVLTASSLPWLGSLFRSTATGLPVLGLAVGVASLSSMSLPLSLVLPQAGAGCTLLVVPDILDLRVATAGSCSFELLLPVSVALVGQAAHQQVVTLELDAFASIVALTSTNALALTFGTL